MPSSSSCILEEAFQILQEATSLEEDPSRKIEAAVNYRKACSLFRKHLDECEGRESRSVGVVDDASQDRLEAKKKLFLEKIAHYERVATRLIGKTFLAHFRFDRFISSSFFCLIHEIDFFNYAVWSFVPRTKENSDENSSLP